MRARLTLAGSAILTLALLATFVAVYTQTGRELRQRIDRNVRDESGAFARNGVPTGTPNTAATMTMGRRYIADQPFRASSRLLFEDIPGLTTLTNQPELLGIGRDPGEPTSTQRIENRQARRLLAAPAGYSTMKLGDLGPLRLFIHPVQRHGRTITTIGVGEPLAPVEEAEHSVASTFAVGGSIALAIALLASYLIASRTLRPLRRMSSVAARVDAGDLSPRMAAIGTRDEVHILADAFDHMLDRLQNAFDRQTTFLADASHELRTPLTVLRGQLEVLARDPEFSRNDFSRVERIAQAEIARMQRLVDDLLLITHSGEPKFLRRQTIGLNGYLEDLLNAARPTTDRRFELRVHAYGHVQADPDRLAQAMRNLIANAIQHTGPHGLVRLTVDAVGDTAVIGVEDDGPGIPAHERQAVFERFHRTDPSRARTAGGTGLGLAIVRAIIEAHGGHVAIETGTADGARLAVFLPGFTARRVAPHEPTTVG